MEVFTADMKNMCIEKIRNFFRLISLFLLYLLITSCSELENNKNYELITQRIDERIERLENYIQIIDFSLTSIEIYLKNGEVEDKIKDLDSVEAYGDILAMLAYEQITENKKLSTDEMQTLVVERLEERRKLMQSEIKSLQKIRNHGLAEYINENMVLIPTGAFDMGSDKSPQEQPIHDVYIQSFYLSKYETTEMLWYLLMGKKDSMVGKHNYNDFTIYYCSECPKEVSSWAKTQVFIQKLNQILNENYRLPSEAEWEYACRSGDETAQYCGGNNPKLLGWFNQEISSENKGNPLKARVIGYPVGSKQSNQFGLYDMSGNIYEWVQDCWYENYEGAPIDGSARFNENCSKRVIRGGGYHFPIEYTLATKREYDYASSNVGIYGFRIAKNKSWKDELLSFIN
jgi:formylglycine-generating enzyme required for sulfatase activity